MRAVFWAVGAFIVAFFAYDLNKLYALRYGADLGIVFANARELAARFDV